MNIKKTMLSTFAALAIASSIVAPSALAQDTEESQQTSSASAVEGGELTFSLGGPAVAFNPATVTTDDSQRVAMTWPASNPHRVFMVNDSHSYSHGYTLRMTASNLVIVNDSHSYSHGYTLRMTASNLVIVDTGYFIDSEYLFVQRAGGGAHDSCLWAGAPEPEGGNPYQTIEHQLGSTWMPLTEGTAVPLMTGSDGRGCGGPFQTNYNFELNVPAGTYTGEGSAVYTGTITVESVNEAGSGDEGI